MSGIILNQEKSFLKQRSQMVKEQLVERKIHDQGVLKAMMQVPRHLFVQPEDIKLAYKDGPLPIGLNQTISQPYIVALMAEALMLKGHENVLEVGTGSGYLAAILGQIAKQVHTIERHKLLANTAKNLIKDLGIDNVVVHLGDGSGGLSKYAPYDGILVSAAAPAVPDKLLAQLKPAGVLVIPVGDKTGQRLQRWTRNGDSYDFEENNQVSFVPLRGEYGWEGSTWQ